MCRKLTGPTSAFSITCRSAILTKLSDSLTAGEYLRVSNCHVAESTSEPDNRRPVVAGCLEAQQRRRFERQTNRGSAG
jgi:hypothetical protein